MASDVIGLVVLTLGSETPNGHDGRHLVTNRDAQTLTWPWRDDRVLP
ncbi:hypothetical protein STSO111631_18975 [Stackebrandtia soli]